MTVTWDPTNSSLFVGLSGGNLTVTGALNATVGVAIDIGNKLAWFRNPLTRQWNGSSTANPATGTGGWGFTPSSGLFPMASGDPSVSGHGVIIGNFGASSFEFPVPSGFSSWNSATSATVTWNPSDKNASIALSNGNLTATINATSYCAVRATNSLSSGKAYYEFTWTTMPAAGFWVVGFGTSSASLSNYVGSTSSASFGAQGQGSTQGVTSNPTWDTLNYTTASSLWATSLATLGRSSGKFYFETTINALGSGTAPHLGLTDGNIAVFGTFPGHTTHGYSADMEGSGVYYNNINTYANDYISHTGKTFGIAVDLGGSLLWTWANDAAHTGFRWNASGTANPATGTGGDSISNISGTLYPAIAPAELDSSLSAVTNFGASAFVNTLPSGFMSWDGSQPATTVGGAGSRTYLRR